MFYTSIMVKHAVKIVLYYLETKATKYSYVELVLFSFCRPGGPLRYKMSPPLLLYVMTAPRARLFLPIRTGLGRKKSSIRNGALILILQGYILWESSNNSLAKRKGTYQCSLHLCSLLLLNF